jgi:SAM-dependent methyltransferase
MSTDAEWERWAKQDPYYGVLAQDRFRTKNLTDEVRQEFFQSGKDQVDYILRLVRRRLDREFSPVRVIDFGCGTGRMLIPLARNAELAVGIDASESMLAEASRNCDREGVANVTLLRSDDTLSLLQGKYDFIHSVIVFQHIPVVRGILIFRSLLNHLADGGVGAIQFTYARSKYTASYGRMPVRPIGAAYKAMRQYIRRIFRNRDPEMQMNCYSINDLLFIVQAAGISDLFAEFTDHGGYFGVYIYFQMPKKA